MHDPEAAFAPTSPRATPLRAKVFLEGSYRKLCRDLPQTVFFCPECKGHPRRRRGCARCEGFGKLTRDSVQELIGWVAGKAFGTRKHKFHGAGREDVDVRMLGGGRPFVLELIAPRQHQVDLAELEAEINRRNAGRLEVLGLHWTEKERIVVLKETPHAKEYEALVEVQLSAATATAAAALAAARALVGVRREIVQHTPERVAHRRADRDRERWIEVLCIEPTEVDRAAIAARPASLAARMPEAVDVVEVAATEAGVDTSDADESTLASYEPSVESGVPSAAPGAAAPTAPLSRVTPAAIDNSAWAYWRVRLRTQHGTYVKEVLSGDSGKTRPCLSEIVGVPCRCVELDVTAILDEHGAASADVLPAAGTASGAGFGAGI
jgi:tRNA U54 and U55 pseudouridine synthase Pus10